MGTWLWLPGLQMTSNARLSLRRPQKLQSSSYLGFTCADESRPLDAAVVQDIFSQKTWGEDALGWEAFLQAIGVQNFQPAEAEHTSDLASRLGASLCAQEWWSGLLKRGLRAQAYVSRRCRGADDAELYWLRTFAHCCPSGCPQGSRQLGEVSKLQGRLGNSVFFSIIRGVGCREDTAKTCDPQYGKVR